MHMNVFLQRPNDRMIIVQILVIIFLCIKMFILLFVSDILVILTYFHFAIQVWLCIIITIFVLMYTFVTPVTLTAMTLERYVAICMPLRHGQLCSTRSTMYCILIIHGVSFAPCIIILSMFFATVSLNFYRKYMICTVELFILYRWQDQVRSAIHQFYFLIMRIIIIFSYVQITKVAKALLLCLIYIVPRCLSPLIYGLRDEKFFFALKNLLLTSSCSKET
uniref:G-protein coupled receptors family 1 profile domain-containing protein n=1 Tax=Neolamprologus brichardi TaxID=32507 RepID=A0A3Q4NA04_NEOBR